MCRQSVFLAKLLGCSLSLVAVPTTFAHANACAIDFSVGTCAVSAVGGLDAANQAVASTQINLDTQTAFGSSLASSAGGATGLSATAGAFADFGVLRATALAQSAAPGPIAFIDGSAGAQFLDRGTVTSNNNIFDGNVDILLTFTLEGTSVGTAGLGPNLAGVAVGNSFFNLTGSRAVTFTVGQTVDFLAFLTVDATASSFSPLSSADYGHSLHVFFDAPDGFTFTAASGHNYSSAAVEGSVPEPSTWTMMILAFCGLGFMAYRRKTTLQLSSPIPLAGRR